MPRLNPDKQIAHALNQIAQGVRLVRQGKAALQQALRVKKVGPKGQAAGVGDGPLKSAPSQP